MGEMSKLEARPVDPGHDRPAMRSALLIAACALIPLSLVLYATISLNIPPRMILGDPATFTEQPSYLGLFSDLGFLGWWTAAISCLLAWSLAGSSRLKPMLLAGGVLSAILCLDDLMLLHEAIGEKPFFAFYALAAVAYVWHFRSVHRMVAPALLGSAILLLSISIGVDSVRDLYERIGPVADRLAASWFHLDLTSLGAGRSPPVDTYRSPHGGSPSNMSLDDLRRILEDGSKFAGIITWAAYHVVLARFVLLGRWKESDRQQIHAQVTTA